MSESHPMQDFKTTEGSCLCGEVRYRITGFVGIFQHCHCSRCRKVTGSAYSANMFVPIDQFEWLSAEELVGYYAVKEARHFASAFCKQCGSNMPWLPQSGKVMVIPAGSLDGDPGVQPEMNIFCDSAAEWFVDPGELPRFSKMPSDSD